jgi:hypothetical protein
MAVLRLQTPACTGYLVPTFDHNSRFRHSLAPTEDIKSRRYGARRECLVL